MDRLHDRIVDLSKLMMATAAALLGVSMPLVDRVIGLFGVSLSLAFRATILVPTMRLAWNAPPICQVGGFALLGLSHV